MADVIKLVLNPPAVAVRPGDSSMVNLSIINVGATVDTYVIEVLGLDPGWIFMEGVPQLSLLPGKQADIRLTFQPPPVSSSRAGIYKVGVRVTRTNDPSRQGGTTTYAQVATVAPSVLVQSTAALDLTVLPVTDFNIEMTPRYMDSRRNGKAMLKVTNNGNTDILFNVTASDPAEALQYRHAPQLGVHAGESENISFETVSRQGKLIGGPIHHDFQITVQPAMLPMAGGRGFSTPTGGTPLSSVASSPGALPKAISGRYTFKPPIPPWFIPAGGAVLMLLVAAGIAIFAIISGNRQKELDATAAAITQQAQGNAAVASQTALGNSQNLTLAAINAAGTAGAQNAADTQSAQKQAFDATSTALAVSGANQLTQAQQQGLATQTAIAQNGQLTNAAQTIDALKKPTTPAVTTTSSGGTTTTPPNTLKPLTDKLKTANGLTIDAKGQFGYVSQNNDKNIVQVNLTNPAAAPVVIKSGLINPGGLYMKDDWLYYVDKGTPGAKNGSLNMYNVTTKVTKLVVSALDEPSHITEFPSGKPFLHLLVTITGTSALLHADVKDDGFSLNTAVFVPIPGIVRPLSSTVVDNVKNPANGGYYFVLAENGTLYRVLVNADKNAQLGTIPVKLTITGKARPATLSAPQYMDSIPNTMDIFVGEQKLPGVSRVRLAVDGSTGTLETVIETNEPVVNILVTAKSELFFTTLSALFKVPQG